MRDEYADILRIFYSKSNGTYEADTAILDSKRLHSFGLKPYFLLQCVKYFIQCAAHSMNALASPSAFDVRFDASLGTTPFDYDFSNLASAPRLPVDLLLILIEIRKRLGWTTRSLKGALLEGIGEGISNPVQAELHADEGEIRCAIDRKGTTAHLQIVPQENLLRQPRASELRPLFAASQPFMPSMNDPLWTPPGLDDPFMKTDKNPLADAPENGWEKGFAMPWTYARMGQEVSGDLIGCRNLPDNAESLFLEFIRAAREIRVSIMGVFSCFDTQGKGHASLAISESDMELMIIPELRRVYATFFTCGNSNPRPALDKLHQQFDAVLTKVSGMVRGNDVPFAYEGLLINGLHNYETGWRRIRLTDELLLGDVM